MDTNRATYELKDELARLSLPSARRDPNQTLAWINSICILFLLIGIVGAREGVISIQTVPPIHQIVPVVLVPTVLPPQITVEQKKPNEEENQPRVVVAIPSAPNIRFSVPTIGTLVAPTALASAPPLNPMEVPSQIENISDTGSGGERPEPDYPQILQEHGEQGTLVLLITSDATGKTVSIEIKHSSGFPELDRVAVASIKNHWHLPTNLGTHLFQTTIIYKLNPNL